jgi:hypothetical protein
MEKPRLRDLEDRGFSGSIGGTSDGREAVTVKLNASDFRCVPKGRRLRSGLFLGGNHALTRSGLNVRMPSLNEGFCIEYYGTLKPCGPEVRC